MTTPQAITGQTARTVPVAWHGMFWPDQAAR